jgi:hypothetical protein
MLSRQSWTRGVSHVDDLNVVSSTLDVREGDVARCGSTSLSDILRIAS